LETINKEILSKNKIKITTIMKIKKVSDKKTNKETEEVKFSSKSLEKSKDDKPSITLSIEDSEQLNKAFKKELEKIHKFEAFIDIHIDNIENVDCETDFENDEEDEFDAEYEESEGCGCCQDCKGVAGCDCGCEDCKCGELEDYCDSCDRVSSQCVCDDSNVKSVGDFMNVLFSESLKYHLDNNKPITENIFRPGSKAFYNVIKEARQLFDDGKIELCDIDKEIYESTEIGKFAYFNGELVPLDLPMENVVELNEAEYKGKEVKLNYPMRNSGGGKKYYVYVKNPKTGNVKKISFGDVHGGLTAKVSNPEARKSFAARHKCSTKKDKTKAGYWACRINKYGHLWGGKTYPGYW
jgi:hypothetical protein